MNTNFKTKYIAPEIKLSCYDGELFKTETLFEQHMLIWFISGETKIIQAEACHVIRSGDIFLIPRNQLATIINYPKDGLPHKAVAMHLTVDRLRSFYADQPVVAGNKIKKEKILLFKDHPLLRSCLASLVPYFDVEGSFPPEVASIKLTEALLVLRNIDHDIDHILTNFDEPEKTDLAKFMEEHYMFNLTLEKFGYLTGRSLSTFNRDFRQRFRTTPRKWLTRKRLELAHSLITNDARKPIDVYLEVGFEDLSHFSYAFKKHFGYPPQAALNPRC